MAEQAADGVSVSIDLGGDRFKLSHLDCVEHLGRPFAMTADVFASLGEIDLLSHLGKPVGITIHEFDDAPRYFHGLLVASEYQRESRFGYHYRLTLRPFTYFMAQNSDYAIYQNQSALAIIKAVFEEAAVQDVDYSKLNGSYAERVYCVQYGESDFDFVSRLMEEEGIYYYFRHEADRHVMVLCDAPTSHVPGSPPTLTFNPDPVRIQLADTATQGAQSFVHKLMEHLSSQGEAKVTMRDFDLEKPQAPVQAGWSEQGTHPRDAVEVYEYPGNFVDADRGSALAKAQLGARRAMRQTYVAECQSAGVRAGSLVTIEDHPVDRLNADYLIVGTHHSLTVSARDMFDEHEEKPYNTRFDLIPAATPFTHPRRTRRPRVRGLETAIVSGPEGETIYTDKYGRVKVRFPWDRSDTPGETSTCWVRVAQFGNLGSLILPRVGQEVMIDFLDGNPDRPVVCGWTFNQSLMPTYELPANKTRALWRTKRYGETGEYPDAKALDTGAPGANELRFEDKGGSEEVFLHAERDMNTRIRFAETHHVGQDQALMIGHDRTDDVGHDETIKIGHDQTATIGNNQTETVTKDRSITIGGTDTLDVTRSISVTSGSTIEITATTSITLTVGMSSIKLDNSGVTIKGPTVSIEGEMTADMKSMKASVQGSVNTTIQGLMVLIN